MERCRKAIGCMPALLALLIWAQAVPAAGPAAPAGTTVEAAGEPVPEPDLKEKSPDFNLEQTIRYFEDLYRADSSEARIRFTIKRPRNTRTLMMQAWSKGNDKSLIVIEKPPREAGIATLRVDDNLWNYLPRISRTIRIPPSMLRGSWMGSDFTNDDLVKESSYIDDFTYALKGRSADPPGWRIEFTAKPEVVGLWDRIELVVGDDGKIPLVEEFYDRKGRLARVMVFDQVKEFDGRRMPSRLTVTPTREEGKWTEVKYLDIRFNIDLPDSTFSLSRLERKRR